MTPFELVLDSCRVGVRLLASWCQTFGFVAGLLRDESSLLRVELSFCPLLCNYGGKLGVGVLFERRMRILCCCCFHFSLVKVRVTIRGGQSLYLTLINEDRRRKPRVSTWLVGVIVYRKNLLFR